MGQRLKLVVSYDGAHFAGWQSQAHGNTVQDHLERSLAQIAGRRVRLHGAGRTDAGVHALGQCAHVDVDNRISPGKWAVALNATLPPEIRVLRCQRVTTAFHARFSAVGKVYRYRIWSGSVLPPLEYGRAWHLPNRLDAEAITAAAAKFVGRHDFKGFAANRGRREINTIRTMHAIKVRRRGFRWSIELDGDGFLYKMVRLMVGAMVYCALHRFDQRELLARLDGKITGQPRFAVPAAGLYLVRVRY